VSVFCGQFVLPDSQNPPTAPTQFTIHKAIAGLIPRQLPTPESAIGHGPGRVLRASVPETAVHQHDKTMFSKHEIRFAKQSHTAAPSSNAVATEERNHCKLSSFIIAPSHARHYS
jgi:hypothetical protein